MSLEFLKTSFRSYLPLITVIAAASLMALVQSVDFHSWMLQMMGYFLCLLAMLKFFDLPGFQRGFRKYDLVTQSFPAYGLIYPAIEFSLGLFYLGGFFPVFTYAFTILFMGVGGLGVVKAIRNGQKLNCACMGNVLSVPLSTVSVIENFGMSVMALAMLVAYYL